MSFIPHMLFFLPLSFLFSNRWFQGSDIMQITRSICVFSNLEIRLQERWDDCQVFSSSLLHSFDFEYNDFECTCTCFDLSGLPEDDARLIMRLVIKIIMITRYNQWKDLEMVFRFSLRTSLEFKNLYIYVYLYLISDNDDVKLAIYFFPSEIDESF